MAKLNGLRSDSIMSICFGQGGQNGTHHGACVSARPGEGPSLNAWKEVTRRCQLHRAVQGMHETSTPIKGAVAVPGGAYVVSCWVV